MTIARRSQLNSGASAHASEGDAPLVRRQKLGEALEHMTAALEILDRNEASAHIGARLVESIDWLREEIDTIT